MNRFGQKKGDGLDERQMQVLLRGAQRLIKLDTPEEDIIANLEELGVGREEAINIIAEARKTTPSKEDLEKTETGLPKGWTLPKKNEKHESHFLRKIFSIGRSYVPKLKTGGRQRVTEIIVESPLDKK